MATPPPMYFRSDMVRGLPSPSSDPVNALCSWQMGQSPLLSWSTFAGWTLASSARAGASRAKSCFRVPAHVRGQL
eukprot:2318757-Pyramimonas_sp.AAC.1